MTVSSVGSTHAVESTGIDPPTPESGAGGAGGASGFDILLAGATSEAAHPEDRSASDGSDRGKSSDADPASQSSDKPKDPAKPGAEANLDGLLAVLAALAWTPTPADATDVSATPPPAETPVTGTDGTTSAPAPAPGPIGLDPTTLLDLTPIDVPAPTLESTAMSGTPAPAPPQLPAVSAPPTPAPTTAHAGAPAAPINGPSGAYADTAPSPADRARAGASSGAALASGSTPTHSAAVAAGIDDGTAAATVTPPPPAEQLVAVLSPLRTTQSGAYTLHLELKPPELGRVEMRVEMRDGVLHASIHAEHQSSAQLLRDSLADLRDRLSADGLNPGELTVSDSSVGSGTRDGRETAAGDAMPGSAVSTTDEIVASAPRIASAIDSEATSLLDVRV